MIEPYPVYYLLAWPLLGLACSFVGLPLAHRALGSLPSGGIFLAKSTGWFLFAFCSYALLHSGWLTNGRFFASSLGWGIVLIALVVWANSPGLRGYLRRYWRSALSAEIIYLLALWAFLVFRANIPGVVGTEAPANFGLLNSAMRSESFPPADVWLAGYDLSYYFFGHAAAAWGSLAAGIPRLLAFDLALAHVFALSLLGAYSLGRDLTGLAAAARSWAAAIGGIGAVAGVLFVGNLAGLAYLGGQAQNDPYFYNGLSWNATRIIRNVEGGGLPACGDPAVRDCPITEFPAFTFLLGDLHAHALALPLVLMAAAAAACWYIAWRHEKNRPSLWTAAFGGAVAGLLLVTNSWDFPGGLLLGPAAGILALLASRRFAGTARFGLHLAIALLAALAVALPQLLSFQPLNLGLALAPIRSQLGPFLLMWGLPLAIIAVWHLWNGLARHGYRGLIPVGLLIVLAAGGEALFTAGALILLLGTMLLTLREMGIAASDRSSDRAAVAGLAAFALLLLVIPEVLIVDDGHPAPYQRMNTMFKLGFSAWILLAACAPAMLIGSWRELAGEQVTRAVVPARVGASLIILGLLSIGLFYTADGFSARLADQGEPSLNALRSAADFLPDDVAAANWAADNLPADSVLMEACCKPYSNAARIANWTGVPTVLGWLGHGFLTYRVDYPQFADRQQLIENSFRQLDRPATAETLRRAGVTHVVLGQLERQLHQAVDPDPLGGLIPVYTAPGGTLTIYAIPRPMSQ